MSEDTIKPTPGKPGAKTAALSRSQMEQERLRKEREKARDTTLETKTGETKLVRDLLDDERENSAKLREELAEQRDTADAKLVKRDEAQARRDKIWIGALLAASGVSGAATYGFLG